MLKTQVFSLTQLEYIIHGNADAISTTNLLIEPFYNEMANKLVNEGKLNPAGNHKSTIFLDFNQLFLMKQVLLQIINSSPACWTYQ